MREQGEDTPHWGERKYVNVDSYDKNNAESILFDVVTELQTNQQLIQEFGQLYNAPRTKEQAALKRISNFITNNGIRVEAHTALTPMRGRLSDQPLGSGERGGRPMLRQATATTPRRMRKLSQRS